jgi:hypothetical protein
MAARAIPKTVDDITADWLSSALGGVVDKAVPHRIGEGVGLLSEIYRVDVHGEDVPRSLVVKISTPNLEARQSATTYRMYEREIRFCQLLAPDAPIRAPKVHWADWDPETEDSVLVMEDLTDMRPGDQLVGLSGEQAGLGLDQLAKLHARWWGDESLSRHTWAGSLVDPTYYVGIPAGFDMLLPVAKQHYGHVLESAIAVLDLLHPQINRLQEHLCRGPNTLLHGDFRGDNLMFGAGAHQPAVALLDFQAVVVGRGEMELGYFLGQSMTIDERRAHERDLVERYARGLVANGVAGYSATECWEDYRFSLLYSLAYGVLMAGLDVTHPPTFAKVELILDRLATAATDLDVVELLG